MAIKPLSVSNPEQAQAVTPREPFAEPEPLAPSRKPTALRAKLEALLEEAPEHTPGTCASHQRSYRCRTCEARGYRMGLEAALQALAS